MHTFHLDDADGTAHEYVIMAPHGAAEGTKIMLKLAALIAGPVGGLIDGLAGKGGPGATGPELSRAILSLGDNDLIKQLLVNVTRDGKALGGASPLAAKTFNDAYQRNYGELCRALWEVVAYNRFLSLPAGMQPALAAILAAAQAKVGALGGGAGTATKPPPSA